MMFSNVQARVSQNLRYKLKYLEGYNSPFHVLEILTLPEDRDLALSFK